MAETTPQLAHGQFFGRRRRSREGRGFLVTESSYESSTKLPVHAHRRAHLCFVVAGRYTEHMLDGDAERRSGDLIFYPPGADHAETHHRSGRHLLVELDEKLHERIGSSHLPPTTEGSERVRTCPARARWTAGRLLREVARTDRSAPMAIEGLVLQLVAEVARARAEEERPEWIDRARETLRRQIESPPGPDELARRLGISDRRLEEGLRRWQETTLPALVRELRVEVAAERLTASDAPLAQIALAAGYYDQSHFTRAFREATGMTPGVYRRTFEET